MLRHLLDSPVEVAHHLFHRVEVVQVAVRDAESKPFLARREHLPHRKGAKVRREACGMRCECEARGEAQGSRREARVHRTLTLLDGTERAPVPWRHAINRTEGFRPRS